MEWTYEPPSDDKTNPQFGDFWSMDYSQIFSPEKAKERKAKEIREKMERDANLSSISQVLMEPLPEEEEEEEEVPQPILNPEYPDTETMGKYKNAILNYKKKHEGIIPNSSEGIHITDTGTFDVNFDEYIESKKTAESSLNSAREGTKLTPSKSGSFISVDIEEQKTSPRKTSKRFAWS